MFSWLSLTCPSGLQQVANFVAELDTEERAKSKELSRNFTQKVRERHEGLTAFLGEQEDSL